MEAGAQQAIEHALVRWTFGDDDGVTTLRTLCTILEDLQVTLGVVRENEGRSVVLAENARAASRILVRVADHAAHRRTLLMPCDDAWCALFEAQAATPSAPAPPATWAACEPLTDADGHESGSTLVAIGWNDTHRDDVLVALPRLARACASLLADEQVAAAAWKLTHSLNNLLTSVLANVEYASHLLDDSGEGSPLAAARPEVRADIAQAMGNAHEAAKLMVGQVDRIGSLGKRAH